MTEPLAITLIETHTDPACNQASGAIDVTVTGGTAPYSYSWSSGEQAEDLTNKASGTYTLTVTDANNCSQSIIVNLNDLNGPQVTVDNQTNVSCNGASDGAIQVSVSGGTAPYTYSWSSGQSIEDLSALPAGTYTLTVTDANNCQATASVTLTAPAVLSLSEVHTDATCTLSNGAINVSVSGGTAPYSYSWNSGEATEDLANKASGTYTLTVTDANNCSQSITVNLNDLNGPQLTVDNQTDISCNGASDGAIQVSVSGGTAPYTYSWSSGQSVEDLSALPAGTYTLTVTDANSCQATASVSLTAPAVLSLSEVHTDATCALSNGAINVSVSGGTAPYIYSWNSGESTEDLIAKASGTYTLTVTDANNCLQSITVNLNDLSGPSVTVDNHTNISCNGASDGAIQVSVSGGTTPYTYSWSSGQSIEDLSALPAGTYTLTVTDANNCQATASVTLTAPAVLSLSEVHTDATCALSNGAINISVSGGTAPYSYSWNSGEATEDLANKASGTYTLTVTDANSCSQSITVTLNDLNGPIITVDNQTNVTCNGSTTGAIDITAAGVGPLNYSWSGPNGFSSSVADLTGLESGTYNLTVTDINNCSASVSVIITEPQTLTLTEIHNDATCSQSTGSINVNVTGGKAPYVYSWNNGKSTESISSEPPGSYVLTVTDANNCSQSISITLNNVTGPLITVDNQTNLTCNGGTDGAIQVSVTGGTAPFTYSWSGGQTTEDISNLTAGTYTLTVTDANNCQATASVSLTEPLAIVLSETHINPVCGLATGAIDITVTNGVAPYSYSWSSGQTTEDLALIPSGTYTLTVTDANNCIQSITVNVNDLLGPLVTVSSQTNISCNGATDGAIQVNASGIGSLSYSWSGPNGFSASTEDLSALAGGTYTLTVTDVNNCQSNVTIFLTEPPVLRLSEVHTDEACGQSNGAVNIIVTGGTAPYSYSWSSGESTEDLANKASGTYTLTVTDANNCSQDITVVLNDLSGPSITVNNQTDISCNGASDGAIQVTANGIGTLAYSWSGPNGFTATTEDLTNLVAGTYTLTVTDANNCQATASVTLTEPSVLSLSEVHTDATCALSNGAINVSVSGGTAPYTYSWNSGEATEDLTNKASGSYTLTVTDANNCTQSITVNLNDLNGPQVTVDNQTNIGCNGSSDGAIQVSVSGGTAPYTYSWSSGQSIEDLSALPAGTYTLTVTDANNCQATASVTLTAPAVLSLSEVHTDASCGLSNGSINVTVAGGTSPYSYSWNSGESTEDLANKASGTYTLTVTDANNCTQSITVNLNDLNGPQVTVDNQTNVSCNGASDGAIQVSVSGGTTPYTYSWSSGQNIEDLSALPAGTYTLTVTDANNCQATASVTLTAPAVLSLSEVHTDASCSLSNGAINVSVSGGTAPYIYSWNSGEATEDLTNKASGTYTLTVTDANNCSESITVNLNDLNGPQVTVDNQTNISCNGASDGAIQVSVSGGTAPYTYSWSSGQTIEDISALPAGTYTLTVTDANNCQATASVTLTEPAVLSLSEVHTDATCALLNGAINVSVSGGTAPYTYSWNSGEATEDLTTKAAGSYTLTVTDANNCSESITVNLNDLNGPQVTVDNQTNVSCNGASDGAIQVSVSGGTAPYTYSWSSGQTIEDISALPAGTYTLTVTDANNCQATASVTLTEPSVLTLSEVHTDATCALSNGAINVSVSGGTAPYTYSWNSGESTEDLTAKAAGSYTLTVTDANNCSQSITVNLNDLSGPLVTVDNQTNVSCNGASDGAIQVSVSGGTAPYTYSWSSGQNIEDLSALPAGTYTLTVTDANNCQATASVTLTAPPVLSLSEIHTDASCGLSNGSINVTVAGGTSPYSYSWNSGESTQDLNNKASGSYSLTVTDVNNCSQTIIVSLSDQNGPQVTVDNQTNVSCNGASDGAIQVSVSGGIAPYTYSWSSGQSIEDLSALPAGTYTLTVTDGNNCQSSASVTLTEPSAISLTETHTDPACNQSTGAVDVSVVGGTAPYSYSWSSGEATEDLANKAAGSYTLTVTDANNCSQSITVNLNDLNGPQLTVDNQTNVSCNGASDGAIQVSISGGTAPYTYNWSSGQSIEDLSALPVGTYTLTVSDANNCQASASVTLTEPLAITLSETHTDPACNQSTGTIDVSVVGGTAPYSYSWSSGEATEDLTAKAAGSYTLTVTDANNCSQSITVTLNDLNGPQVTVDNQTNVSCNGASDGAIQVSVSGGTAPYTYSWSSGQSIEDLSALPAGTYTLTVTDANNCQASASVTLTEPLAITLSETHTDPACNQASGAIDVTVTGGTAPYSYSWSSGEATEDLTNKASGSYTLTVTDANNCSQSITVNLNDLNGPQVTVDNQTNVSCNGALDGAINVSASGTGTLTYSWSGPNGFSAQADDLTNLAGGTYTLTVTDANNCQASASVTLSEPSAISLSETHTDPACNQATGAIDVSIVGGTAPYTYSWDSGEATEDLTNKAAGSYTLTVTDANNCSQSITVTLNDLNGPQVTVDNQTNVSCNGASDGAIQVSVSGGTAPYTYSWSSGQSIEDLSALPAGTYTLTVTDANNCQASASVTLTEPLAITLSETHTDLACNQASGAIDVTVTGGTAPYSYSWSSGEATEDLTNKASGSYTLTVTDANNCSQSITVNLNDLNGPQVTVDNQTNVSCNGASDGAIQVSVSGGTAPYTYSWSSGQSIEDLSALPAGTYTLTITDANNCQASASVTLTEPLAITLSETHTDPACNQSTGTIDVSVVGGTAPYSYSWSSGEATEDLTNKASGSYILTVTDANSCSQSITVTLNDLNGPQVTVDNQTNISCNGASDGAIQVSVSGGTAPYTYSWSSGQSIEDLSALPAGTYTLTVTDANNCQASASVTLTEPLAISLSETHTDPACNQATGAIDVSVVGGAAPYSYSWSSGEATEDLANKASGSYTLTVTDANSCSQSITVNLNDLNGPVITVDNQTNVSCNGAADGAINVTVTGTGALTYSWSGPNGFTATTEDLTTLAAGTYTLTVTDANNCQATVSVTLLEPLAITLSETHTDPACNQATGAIDVSVVGGTAPYSYSWSTGETTEDLTNKASGSYILTVTDANSCSQSITVTLNDLNGPQVTVDNQTNVSCNGAADGAINVIATGTGTLTYAWSGPNGFSSQADDLTNLAAGTYTLTVTDGNNCQASASVTLTEPLAISLSETHTDPACNQASGAIDVTVTGGTAPYSYSWSSGEQAEDLTNKASGSYTLTVTDANNCSQSIIVNLNDQNGPVITVDNQTNVSCNGSADGAINVSASGTGTLTYSWSGPNGFTATTEDLTTLAAGTYTLTVIDANNCQVTVSVTLLEPLAISLSETHTDPACNQATGAIDVSVVGGTAPYTYSWDSGEATEDLTNKASGSYTLTVTDANNCSQSITVNLNDLNGPQVTVDNQTNVSCNGASDGAIQVSVSGGTAPYTYSWSSGQNIEDLSALPAGTYTLTVTDANNCQATASVVLTEPSVLSLSEVHTDASCALSNGAINVSVSGGIAPYTYSWNSGEATEDLTNKASGSYTLTVTDANNCSQSITVNLNDLNGPQLTVDNQTNVTCNGSADGAINVTATGTGTLTYSWSGPNGFTTTTEDLSALPAGTYTLTVTDANNCQASASVTLTEPLAITLSETHTDPACNQTSGAIDVTVTVGTAPYSYSWSSGEATEDLANKASGSYTLTVTDANNCSESITVNLNDQNGPVITVDNQTNISCNGAGDGTINVTASGTGTLTYSWSGPNGFTATTEDLSALTAGTYTLTVTDGNNCQASASVTLTEPSAISLSETHTDPACNQATGAIDVSVVGGTAPYSYSWSSGEATEDLANKASGSYTLTVTDANNCSQTITVGLSDQNGPVITVDNQTNISCNGAADGVINITASGTGTLSYSWSGPNGFSAMTDDLANLAAGTYTLTVTDGNNCQASVSVTLSEPSAISLSETHTDPACNQATGAIDVSVVGGTAPYSYSWSSGEAAEDLTNKVSGSYTLTVTDANNCSESITVILNDLNGPQLTVNNQTNVSCNGASDGAIQVSVSGGTAPYIYSWSSGQSSEDLSALPAGTYTLTVTDGNNCQASASVTLTEPSAISLSETHTDPACNQATGAIDVSVVGGTAPYSYSWSSGEATEDLNNKASGSYTLTVTDANNCSQSITVILNDQNGPAITVDNQTNVSCNGAADGAINVTATGTGTLTYSWSGPNGFTATTEDLSALAAGTYTLTVTDGNNCQASASVTLSEPLVITLSEIHTDPACNQASGAIDVSVVGGTAPYSYSWSSGEATEDLTAKAAGSYILTVTDANNCSQSITVNLNDLNGPQLTVDNQTNISCNSAADGAINVTATGTGTLTYSWSGPNGFSATTEDLANLAAGTYTLTVTDGNNCQASASVTLSEPLAITLSEIHTDPACNQASGAIDVTVTGGSAPYSYSWSSGEATEDLTNKTSGSYTLTVTDANNCSESITVNLNDLNGPQLTVDNQTNVSCNGASDGAIQVSVSGGTAPYTYSWSSGQSIEDLSALPAGTYTLTVTDANNCQASASVTLTEPLAITLSETHTDPACNQSTGTIDVSVVGGTAPYSYLWNSGEATEDLTNKASGSYTLTVTDANNCSQSITVNLNDLNGPQVTVDNQTNVRCNGASDGAIQVSVSGGTAPYTYSWSSGQSVEDLSALPAGTYTLTVTDGNNCQSSASFTLTEPSAISLSETHTDPACNQASGAIDVTVTGGTAPYTYSWNSGESTQDLTNKASGSYTLTVTDANNCSQSITVNLNDQNGPVITVDNQTNVTCNGSADGAINVSASGTGTLTYSWSSPNAFTATTEDLSALAAGTYTLTVTDGNNCQASASVTLTEPSAISLSETHTDPTCNQTSGAIDVSVVGGTAPYSYSWSSGEATEDLTAKAAGSYILTVTDANNCSQSITVNLNDQNGPAITVDNQTNVSCNGAADGAINVTATGTGTLTYSWSGPNSFTATTEDLSALAAGTYTLTVTDGNNCQASASVTLTEPLAITLSETHTDPACNQATGAIDVSVVGGTAPFSYSWSSGEQAEDLNNKASGSYTLTVTDANNCSQSITVILNDQNGPAITVDNQTNVSCNGAADGAINVTATGTGTLTYSWSGPNGFTATTEDLSALAAGTYTLTVTDGNNCQASASVTLTEPSAISLSETHTDSACNQASGAIDVSVVGGTAPYSYSWSSGEATEDLTAKAAGSYILTVTDANNCSQSITVNLNDLNGPQLTVDNQTNISCNSAADGAINVTATGTGTLTYSWSGPNGFTATTEDLSALAVGTYTLTVTDGNNCQSSASVTLTEPSAISLSETHTDPACNQATGAIDVNVVGGTAPYTYSWNSGESTQDLTNKASGSYTLTVTDANNCSQSITVSLNDQSGLQVTVDNQVNISCNGSADGQIQVSVSGGTAPYLYSWSSGQTIEDLTNLPAGTYTLTVTDVNNCQATASVTLIEPQVITLSETHINPVCGLSTGAINITVAGGSSPYSYSWSTGQVTQDLALVPSGSYTLTVTDANNCSQSIIVNLNDLLGPSITVDNQKNVSCNGATDGAINVTSSGTGTLSYSWTGPNGFSAMTEDLANLAAGTYTLTVTDGNNCQASASVTLSEPLAIILSETHTDPACNQATGAIDVSVTGVTAPYSYSWSSGEATEDLTNKASGSYTLTVTDANNCSQSITVTLNDLNGPQLTVDNQTNVSCNGALDGAVNVSASGTGTLTYSWSGPNGFSATTEDLTSLAAGTYTLTVTDGNNCQSSASVTLTEPSVISLTETHTDPACNQATGAIDVTVTGGTAPYSYSWSSGEATEDLTTKASGSYTLTVTDANNCSQSITVNLNDLNGPQLTVDNQTNVSCNGASDGAIQVSVSGGTAPYTYSWSSGQFIEDLSALPAGTYTLTVTDANNCQASASVTMTEPLAISLSETHTDPACNQATGAIDVSVVGGTAPYSYSWSSGEATEDLTAKAAGSYILTVTDANNCSQTITVGLSDQNGPVITVDNQTNVSCNGAADGAINVTATGTSTLTYSWSGPNGFSAQAEDLSSLPAGTYTLTVTDGNNCQASASVTLTEPSVISLSETHTDPACNQATGAIDVNVVGGTAPYTYSWNSGESTQDLTNKASGSYTLTVTDANNCSQSITVSLNDQSGLQVIVDNQVNINCNGSADGEIQVSVSGGTAPYLYSWSSGQTIEDLTNLPAGTYTLTVTDVNNCQATASVTLIEPQVITLSETHINPVCGLSTGAINITVAGGSSPYSYSWSTGQVTQDLGLVPSGSYTLTVTDANNCSQSIIVNLNDLLGPSITVDNQKNVSCNGAADGAINVTSSGTGTLSYSWTGPNGFSAMTEDLANLAAGTYTLTVTDGNNCQASASVTLSEPLAIILSETHTDPACNQATGAIDVSVTGGTVPYIYSWNSGENIEDVSGKVSGVYTLTVTDANNCSQSLTISLSDLDGPVLSVVNQNNVTCNGALDGAIQITTSGGKAPYTYLWNTGQTSEDIFGISGGNYTLTVTDANGCKGTAAVVITEPSALTLAEVHANSTCTQSNGSIDIMVSGGTAPYVYNWSNGQTTEDLNNLPSGVYSITVRDANNCSADLTIVVNDENGPTVSIVKSDVSCFSKSDGVITINVTGGKAPFEYSIDGNTFNNRNIFNNLLSGNYNLVVRDANRCETQIATVIAEPSEVVISSTTTAAGCNGESKGAASVTVTGGTGRYTYNWSGPGGFAAVTKDITGVRAGDYVLTITDNGNCDYLFDITIAESGSLQVASAVTNSACNGAATGSIFLTVSGGRAPYTYKWSDGTTAANLQNLSPGVYQVIVTDANGCESTVDARVGVNEIYPIAENDQYSGLQNNTINGNVMINDFDTDGQIVSVDLISGVQNGTLTLNKTGAFQYEPTTNFSGADSFTYYVTDDCGLRDTATVAINVKFTNHAPIAVNDRYSTQKNEALIVSATNGAISNDSDEDGDPLTATIITQTKHGSVIFNADGSFIYTPDKDYVGMDTLTYTVSDGALTSNVATVVINVLEVKISEMDLAIKKTAETHPVVIDDIFSYTIVASNLSSITVNTILVKDVIPDGLEYVDASALKGAITYNASERRLEWNIDSLRAGEQLTLNLRVRVKEVGTFTNVATITAPGDDKNLSNNVSSVRKTVMGFIIPNAFSPNNDGINDLFVIKGIETMDSELIIYNRYGNEIIRKRNYQNDWDGSSLPSATYYYVVAVRDENNAIQKFAGAVTIVR
nr:Ig-like domain-containing protein [Solitalea agri]